MNKFTKVSIVLENVTQSEITGTEALSFVDGYINLDLVEWFRQSTNDKGELEPYTYVYLMTGHVTCVNMPIEKFIQLLGGKTSTTPKEDLDL